ncbi:MAG: sigma-70 family RNA polymerase sigma factor [Planctomycetia bacterium]|nr:sigma-70 family RNA polymerase sigma factor [Planctomycetia bacterium]
MSRTDTALLALRRSGAPEGFEEIVRRYADALFRTCARRLRDRQLAEDAVQETFLRAWRGSATVAPPEVAGWLFGIARHVCQESARRRRRAAEGAAPLDEERTPAAAEPAAALDLGIDALDDFEQALLHLRHGEGLTCREIAAKLSKPVGTVTSALSRAYARLRSRLAAAGRAE